MPPRLVIAAITAAWLFVSPPVDQQVFRSSVDGILIPVSVKRGNKPVDGLGPADFELRDNGVEQTIRGASSEQIPVDVTFLLDVSASVDGPALQRLKGAVADTSALLRPADRMRLISISQVLHEIFDLQPKPNAVLLDSLTAEGATSLYDGIAAAMMRPADTGRRQLVVAFTDGRDSTSIIEESVAKDIARLTDAVVTVVVPVNPGGVETRRLSQRAGAMDSLLSGSNVSQGGQAKGSEPEAAPKDLIDLVQPTGGEVVALQPGDSISRTFRSIFEEFRAGYVLQYTPQGVAGKGWHEVEVTVKRRGKLDVRARKGYMAR
jgi:VWFA-related protein